MTRALKIRACSGCGCTDDRACPGGCWWIGPNRCSRCRPAGPLTAARVRRPKLTARDIVVRRFARP